MSRESKKSRREMIEAKTHFLITFSIMTGTTNAYTAITVVRRKFHHMITKITHHVRIRLSLSPELPH